MPLVEIHREVIAPASTPSPFAIWIPAATGLVTSLVALCGVIWSNSRTLRIANANLKHAEKQAAANRRWDLDQRRYEGLQAGLSDLITQYQDTYRAMSSQWNSIQTTSALFQRGADEVSNASDEERAARIGEIRASLAPRADVHDSSAKSVANSMNAFMLAYTRIQLQAGKQSTLIGAIHKAATDLRAWVDAQNEAIDSLSSQGKLPDNYDVKSHQNRCGAHTASLMASARELLRGFEDAIVCADVEGEPEADQTTPKS